MFPLGVGNLVFQDWAVGHSGRSQQRQIAVPGTDRRNGLGKEASDVEQGSAVGISVL